MSSFTGRTPRGGAPDQSHAETRGGVALAEASLRRAQAASPMSPGVGLYNELLRAIASAAAAGKATAEDAQEVLARMESASVTPDGDSLRLLLEASACDARRGQGGGIAAVNDVMNRMKAAGGKATDLGVFTAALSCLAADAGGGGGATGRDGERVLERIRAEGLLPDVSCYNAQLEVIARAARHGRARVSEGLAVLKRMRAEGLDADITTFRSLMDITAWCARRGRAGLKDAEAVVSRPAPHQTISGLIPPTSG